MGIRMGPSSHARVGRLIAGAALAGLLFAAPGWAGNQASTSGNLADAAVSSSSQSSADAATATMSPDAAKKPTLRQKLKAKAHAVRKRVGSVLHRLNPKRAYLAARYRKAQRTFPGFCNQWQAKLDARNANNLSHLKWQEKNGWETALYTSYGKITGCETKESKEGIPIGKLTYEEYSQYIVGHSRDEALQAKPKTLAITDTLEIFRFDRGRWFY